MSEQNNIPNHWQVKTLGEIAKWGSGGTPLSSNSGYYNGDIPWLIIGDLNDNFVCNSEKKITELGLNNSSAKIVKAGSVLIAMYGSIGKLGINTIPLATNQAIAFTENLYPEVYNKYLFHYLFHIRTKLHSLGKGGTQKNISQTVLKQVEIPIPPIPEQLAIVSKIEELLSDLENGKQQLLIAQQQLKVYRQSLLKAAFEGRLTNKEVKDGELPKGWKWVTITDLAENNKHALKAGPFGSALKKEFYVETGYKIYGQEQVIIDNPYFGDYYINEEKYQELKSCRIKPFDVLISLVGTVGKVLILPENCMDGIINPRLIKISLNRQKYLPKFFKYYFESSSVKAHYKSQAQGTTMDVLNLGIIKKIPFPLTTLEEQQKVVDELESKLTVCDKIEETISRSLLQAETLKQSILKKAFEGKLL